MRPIPAILLVLAAMTALPRTGWGDAPLRVPTAHRATPCLPLHPARVTLSGAPQVQLFARAPGDAAPSDTAIMFALDQPADVCADSGRGLSHPATRVASVQLVGAPRTVHTLIGYSVEVVGRLSYALPGQHHAEVVLYVERLPLPGTDRRSARRRLPDERPAGAR